VQQAQQLVQALSPALGQVLAAPPGKSDSSATAVAPRTEFSFALQNVLPDAQAAAPKGTPASLKREVQADLRRLNDLKRQAEPLARQVAAFEAKKKVTQRLTFGTQPRPDADAIYATKARLDTLNREIASARAQAEFKMAYVKQFDGNTVRNSARETWLRTEKANPYGGALPKQALATAKLAESQLTVLQLHTYAAYARSQANKLDNQQTQLEHQIAQHPGNAALLWQQYADLQAPLESAHEAADRLSAEASLASANFQVAVARDSVAELETQNGQPASAQQNAAFKDAQTLLRATLEERQVKQAEALNQAFESALPPEQRNPQSKEDWTARNAAQFAFFQQHKEALSAPLLGQQADLFGHGQYLPASSAAQQRNLIGVALGLPVPQNPGTKQAPNPTVDWYTGAAREAIDKIQARINEFGPNAKVAVIPMVSADTPSGVTTMPLFKVLDAHGKTHYVNHTGAKYSSWQDFNENNKLSTEGTLVLHDPSGQLDADGLPQLTAVTANVTTAVEHVKNPLISAGLVIGGVVINGVAVVADSTGVGLVAGVPLHVVGTGFIVAGTVHGTASSVHNLWGIYDRGGSLNPSNREALAEYINIVASVTGLAGAGFGVAARSAMAYTTATRAITAEIIASSTNPAVAQRLLLPLAQANSTALNLTAASAVLNLTSNGLSTWQSAQTGIALVGDLQRNDTDAAKADAAALAWGITLTLVPHAVQNGLTKILLRNHAQAPVGTAAITPTNALLMKRAMTQPFVGPALTTLPQPRPGNRVLVVYGDIDRIGPSDLSPWAVPVRINPKSSLETGDLWKGSGRQQIEAALSGADIEGGTTIYRAWRHPRTDQLLFSRYDRNATHRASEQTQHLMTRAIPPGYPDFKAIHYTDETPHAVLDPDAVDARALTTTRVLTAIAQHLPRIDTLKMVKWAADLPQRSQRQEMTKLVRAIPDANVPIAARWLNHFLMGSGDTIQMTRRETDLALPAEALTRQEFAPETVLRAEIQRQIDAGQTSGHVTGTSEVLSLPPILGYENGRPVFNKYVNAIGNANFTSLYKGDWQVDAQGKVHFSGKQVHVLEDRHNFQLDGFNGKDESPGIQLSPAFVNSLPPEYHRSFVKTVSTIRTGLARYVMNSLFAHFQALRGGAKPFDTFGISSERSVEATWDMR
jgi:hypothetical protein